MIERHLLRVAEESLRGFRVTVINGPRQSGKTTLAKQLVEGVGSYWSLDDESVRTAARLDPHGFVEQGSSPMAIDEVQRGGNDVVLAVKSVVDRRADRGQFVLAGSTRFLAVPQLSESLAGRAEILDLWTLSQGELVGVRESFLDTVLLDPEQLARRRFEQLDRRELFIRLARGGYPELVDATPAIAARWYRNYVRTVVERDIIEASAITQADELPKLLRLLAANTSGEMVVARVAGDAGMSADTVSRYMGLLELVGFVVRIKAWTPSLTSREKRHPKVIITDTGLACGLLGRNAEGLGSATSPLTGALLESFVAMELVKQLGWSERQPTIRHWRDRNGAEVDLIVEDDSGSIAGIEVKAASTVSAGDVRHLYALRGKLGERFVAGIVLYLGDIVVPLGERVWALPVSMIWAD
ncbi:MAG: ATP-binding protein [Acidimicrobiales bacterium]